MAEQKVVAGWLTDKTSPDCVMADSGPFGGSSNLSGASLPGAENTKNIGAAVTTFIRDKLLSSPEE